MKPLITAIVNLYDAGGDFATNTNGLFLHEARQGTSAPYAVFQIIVGMPDYYFDSERIEDVTFQLDIISDNTSSEEVLDLFGYAKNMFDDSTLTVAGYGHLLLERTRYQLFRHAEDNIWRVSVDYDVLLEKT